MSLQSKIANGLKPGKYQRFFQAYLKTSLSGKATKQMLEYAEHLQARQHRGVVMFNQFRNLGV